VKGRHTSGADARAWAPNAKQAAMTIAPIAALVIAVGAGGVGLVGNQAPLAAAGAAAGVGAVLLEQANSRAARRRLRQDRGEMRSRVRDLEATVETLRRELAAVPAVLIPTPPPSPITGPLPMVDAFDLPATPATPRSLPILTANRRGLQSCAPELPGMPVPVQSCEGDSPLGLPLLPGQRPPATPITGLLLPVAEEPSLPKLEPGPHAPVLSAAGVPRLDPGPSDRVGDHPEAIPPASHGRHAGRGRHAAVRPTVARNDEVVTPPSEADLALVGAALTGPLTGGTSTDLPAERAEVLDLRTVAAVRPATAILPAAQVEELVYSAISAAEAPEDELTRTLEPAGQPPAASLFEPGHRAGAAPGAVVTPDPESIRRLAAGAREAARGMRASLPPSPFFTPGAFVEPEATRSA